MKKYEIRSDSFELRHKSWKSCTADEIADAWGQEDHDSELIAAYDSKDAALAALKNEFAHMASTRLYSQHGAAYLGGTVVYVEKNVYDEDGEWVEAPGSGDILEIFAEPFYGEASAEDEDA